MALFTLPFIPAISGAGLIAPAARLFFYETGTSTLSTVYADAANTTPLANPVIANSVGRFVDIFLDESKVYRVRLETALGALIDEADPVSGGGVGTVGFDPNGTYPAGSLGEALQGKANRSLNNLTAVNTAIAQDSLTYPLGNELETYTNFSLAFADKYNDKREFPITFYANFTHGPSSGTYEYEDHKALMYMGANMDLACRKAWVFNPLLTIKPTCVDPQFAPVAEFDINNFNKNFGSVNGAAGLGAPSAYGVMVAGSNATSHTITAGYVLINPPGVSCFERGYLVAFGAAKQAAFDDCSNAVASYRDLGTHFVGVDLSGGTYTAGAIYIPNGASILGKTFGGAPSRLINLSASDNLLLGDPANHVNVIVERNFLPSSDNAIQLGATGARFSSVWAANGTIQTSDATLKNNIEDIDPAKASIFIEVLGGKSWHWNVGGRKPIMGEEEKEVEIGREMRTIQQLAPTGETEKATLPDGRIVDVPVKKLMDYEVEVPIYEKRMCPVVVGYEDVPGVRRHFGVLAKDVKAAADAAGLDDFGGYVVGEDGTEAVRPDQIMAMMLVEMKTMRARIAELEAK